MSSSTRTLPDGYRQTSEINLARDMGLMILVNLVGTVIFVLSLILLGSFLDRARPDFATSEVAFTLNIFGLFGLFVSLILTVLLHELIHGVFFWAFTGSRPVFALRLLYAYAAAPDWFIPARHYWIIGLAPLVLIGMLGLLIIALAPIGWIPLFGFLVALNTAGATGDLFIIARLLRLSPDSLINDAGDRILFFEPPVPSSNSV